MDVDDIALVVFTLAWTLLFITNRALKNRQFDIVFPTQDALRSVYSAANLTFADGLLDTMRAASPPDIEYFKSLTLHLSDKVWAVYLLVLEKDGHRPRTYVGSATNSTDRAQARMYTYDKRIATGKFDRNVPRYVEKSLQEGFTITHKGFLLWAPKSARLVVIPFRLLFLLLEAVFAMVFWTMKSRDKDYYMPHLCPWPRSEFTYDGLCSHFSIHESATTRAAEPVLPYDPRTPEELSAAEAERDRIHKQLKIAQFKKHRAKNLELQLHKCEACMLTFVCNSRLEDHYRTNPHLQKIGAIPRVLKGRGGSQSNIMSKKYWCAVCEWPAPNKDRFKIHMNGNRHAKRLEVLAGAAAK